MKTKIKSLIFTVLAPFIKRTIKSPSIFLTFDDGPHPINTPIILDALEEASTKATFFMLGSAMEKYPEIVLRAISAGHTIGYHSYQHISLKRRNLKSLRKDVAKMNCLSKRFNITITLYRPPFGDLTAVAMLYFIFKGIKVIMWSLDSRDSFDNLSEVLKIISPENISRGEIILFHDDYSDAEQLIQSSLKLYRQAKITCDSLE